jgi:hypothetical protein
MSRQVVGAAVLSLVVGMSLLSVTKGVEPMSERCVLAGLKVGQPVTLKDLGSVYEVRVMDDKLRTGEEVAEVGVDYLAVKSEAGIETRIPVTSIKAVIRVLTR